MTTKKHEVPQELLASLLADYKKPEDLIGENGLLKHLSKLLGTSPAKAIRASRMSTLHQHAECKTAKPSDLHAAESCSPGDVHVRTSLDVAM